MGILPKINFIEILENNKKREEKEKKFRFGKTFLVDFQRKKFLKRDGKLIKTDDERSVRMYIEKALLTVKHKYQIYENTEYGMEYQTNLLGRKYPNEFLKAEYIRELNDILSKHPKIIEIKDLDIVLKRNPLLTSFIVVLENFKTFKWESDL